MAFEVINFSPEILHKIFLQLLMQLNSSVAIYHLAISYRHHGIICITISQYQMAHNSPPEIDHQLPPPVSGDQQRDKEVFALFNSIIFIN